jgi:phage terminase large subunit GpA-like protein
MPPPDNWSAAERLAWAPAERLTPSQWAERYAVIPDNGINPEPGPLSLDRTPYFRGVLDAIADPLVEELVFLKPTQVGYSTLLRVLLGYWIDADPGPCLVVLPDELSAKEWLDEDVRPTLEQTDRLARHLSSRAWDTKKTAIKLASMSIFAAWAGSPQRLARRPIRYGLFDEIDKYPPFSGREADPISLALKRLSNWGKRARAIFGSTPTVRDGNIWKRFQACPDKRYYQIPCPHCEVYQRLIWPQVKGWRGLRTGDKVALANEILIGRVAYYECAHCHEKIEDRHKPRFLLKGDWASEGQTIDRDGTIRGERVRSTRIGFGLNSLYSPWLSFSTLAAEWVMAEGDLGATMDFRNSREAMPFEIQVAKTRPSHVRDKVQEADAHGNYRPRPGAPEPLVVPKWAVLLLATADTQGNDSKDGWFPWVIRAWGYGLRSQLVHFGIVSTFEELQAECLDRQFPIEGGGRCQPQMLLIDAGGNRWSEVMQFCGSDRVRIHPTKGNAKAPRLGRPPVAPEEPGPGPLAVRPRQAQGPAQPPDPRPRPGEVDAEHGDQRRLLQRAGRRAQDHRPADQAGALGEGDRGHGEPLPRLRSRSMRRRVRPGHGARAAGATAADGPGRPATAGRVQLGQLLARAVLTERTT